jgi:hypothetical protein
VVLISHNLIRHFYFRKSNIMSHSQSNFNSGSGSGSIASLKNDSEIFFSSSDTDTSSSMEKLETSSISVQKPTRP